MSEKVRAPLVVDTEPAPGRPGLFNVVGANVPYDPPAGPLTEGELMAYFGAFAEEGQDVSMRPPEATADRPGLAA